MFKKTTIIIAVLFILLTSSPTSAQTDNTSQIPELNPFCWHRKDCQNIRKQFGGTGTGDEGFISDASVAPCVGGEGDDQWGRCLPAGTTKTEISFGGKSEFSNIGEFIILMYKYLLTIASIVAVVVVIIAGMQWVSSGGNSEAISSAKKRIGGAVIGLFIAYMSYFVLNTINPALVNLRLPQVWLIKPQSQLTEFCADLPGARDKIKFAFVASKDEPNKPVPPAAERQYIAKPKEGDLLCGSRYLAENGGESTCRGDGCGSFPNEDDQTPTTCFDKKGDGSSYKCENIRIGGKITYSGGITEPGFIASLGSVVLNRWDNQPIRDRALYFSCNNSAGGERWSSFYVDTGTGSADRGNNSVYYLSVKNKAIDEVVERCADNGGVQGFVLHVDMMTNLGDLEGHFIGRNGADLGDGPIVGCGDCAGDQGFFLKNWSTFNSKYLFSTEEIRKGVRMNIDAGNILSVHDNNDKVQAAYKNKYLGQ